MALLSSLSGGNEGNAQGLQARQQALKDIGAGALKNTPAAPVKKAAPSTAAQDKVNPSGKYGDKADEKRIDTKDMTKPLGSFHKGGKVKKTGVYRLKNKERVLSPKQTAKFEKKGGLAAMLGGK